ncbi:MAG: hypothetical protein P1V20_19135 [Verrucomicrobiales bacterium]|nr:hypothetical protein [Verrucomicrobiales bacterium]
MLIIIDTGKRHNLAARSWFGTPEQALRTIKQGARFMVYGNDGFHLTQAMDSVFPGLRTG